jgi:predicted DNA-binding transcriptional regulator YafY
LSQYDHLLSTIPAQLEAAVVYILSYHTGRDRAIGRDELVEQVKKYGVKADERQIRESIKSLRRNGHLIASAAGEDGGYYLAKDRIEYDEFMNSEYRAKISDMAETVRALDKAADEVFGSTQQMALF